MINSNCFRTCYLLCALASATKSGDILVEEHEILEEVKLITEIKPPIEETLYVVNQKIYSLPIDQFRASVTNLTIKGNLIETIHSDAFQNMNNLRNIDLSFNNINKIWQHAFDGLNNLEDLNLSHNKLKLIELNLFKDLKRLKVLDLGFNSLEMITKQDLNGLDNLEVLKLENNAIGRFDMKSIMENYQSLSHIDLRHNPIRCKMKPGVLNDLEFNYVYARTTNISANTCEFGI